MSKFAVVQIGGRQYKVEPNKALMVDFLGDIKTLECEQVLLSVDGEKFEIGAPYLQSRLKFEVIGSKKEKKIRVAKFHAKANTRKMTGSRRMVSEIKLVV